ncbi:MULTISPECIES: hypothetical protein [unclassified Methylobacterium]|uniref:hypothetical protein n=1 Tax=unclassified Methylobacterium TaxID=2615210 RepID=UPI001F418567|nr:MULTISPECIES: hypothetical protein [Methylobacterium]WFT78863.1 hypothetical protein QA634_26915 [Methylobacterium nodulans]
MVVHGPDTGDGDETRERTGKAPPAFAASIGVPVSTRRQREHRRRQPQGPARVLLALPEKNPRLAEETLGAPPAIASAASVAHHSRRREGDPFGE